MRLGDLLARALTRQGPVSHLTLLESQVAIYGLGQCSPGDGFGNFYSEPGRLGDVFGQRYYHQTSRATLRFRA